MCRTNQLNMSNAILTIDQYAEKVAKTHRNTVLSRIKNGQLPTNHKVIKGKQYFIEVQEVSERCKECEKYYIAACYFHDKKKSSGHHIHRTDENLALAAQTVIRFELNTNKFFKMMGL